MAAPLAVLVFAGAGVAVAAALAKKPEPEPSTEQGASEPIRIHTIERLPRPPPAMAVAVMHQAMWGHPLRDLYAPEINDLTRLLKKPRAVRREDERRALAFLWQATGWGLSVFHVGVPGSRRAVIQAARMYLTTNWAPDEWTPHDRARKLQQWAESIVSMPACGEMIYGHWTMKQVYRRTYAWSQGQQVKFQVWPDCVKAERVRKRAWHDVVTKWRKRWGIPVHADHTRGASAEAVADYLEQIGDWCMLMAMGKQFDWPLGPPASPYVDWGKVFSWVVEIVVLAVSIAATGGAAAVPAAMRFAELTDRMESTMEQWGKKQPTDSAPSSLSQLSDMAKAAKGAIDALEAI